MENETSNSNNGSQTRYLDKYPLTVAGEIKHPRMSEAVFNVSLFIINMIRVERDHYHFFRAEQFLEISNFLLQPRKRFCVIFVIRNLRVEHH